MLCSMLYFAYGSNLDLDQMGARCAGSEPASLVVLKNHRLVFRGQSRLRSKGVLSIEPDPRHHVPGRLYRVTEDHLCTLDRYEGHPRFYRRVMVEVHDDRGKKHAALSYALPNCEPLNPPVDEYLAIILKAYRALGFCEQHLIEAASRSQ